MSVHASGNHFQSALGAQTVAQSARDVKSILIQLSEVSQIFSESKNSRFDARKKPLYDRGIALKAV
jgi:hypothetical protein